MPPAIVDHCLFITPRRYAATPLLPPFATMVAVGALLPIAQCRRGRSRVDTCDAASFMRRRHCVYTTRVKRAARFDSTATFRDITGGEWLIQSEMVVRGGKRYEAGRRYAARVTMVRYRAVQSY